MTYELLELIEWHDLPVAALSLTERGVELIVTSWVEAVGTYARYTLLITEAEKLQVNVTGSLASKDFRDLEVSAFDYALDPAGRISGTIGILPGAAGFWTISFSGALWSLEKG